MLYCPRGPMRINSCREIKGKRKEMFKDALSTFYLRLFGVGHMVKDNSDSERGILYMHHLPTDRIAHTTAFVKLVIEYWNEKQFNGSIMTDRSDDPPVNG